MKKSISDVMIISTVSILVIERGSVRCGTGPCVDKIGSRAT